MGFFETHQTDNTLATSLSIVLLNYNCAATSYVLYFLKGDEDIDSSSYAFATLSLMLGLFLGQILFGLFGDTIGRKRSFLGSSILLLLGSVLSIFPGMIPILSGKVATIVEFSVFRFILGLGAGGMYPLVAAITRESSQEDLANTTIALVFGPYGSIGLILAPLIVFLMTGVDLADNYKWRIILAIGAAPAFLLLIFDISETVDIPIQRRDCNTGCTNWLKSLTLFTNELSDGFSSPIVRTYMFGSSLSWFFSDILHYGNVLMQAKFLDSLLKKDEYDDDYNFSIGSLALMGIASATCFWIGGMASLPALRHISALALQLQGFSMTSAAFFLVTLSKVLLPSTWWPLTIFFYASTFFFNGFGPAPTTFLIPSLLFPASIRTTANGLAAAVGKIGAIVGIIMASYIGLEISNLMACFGAVALMGVGSTLVLIQAHFKVSSPKGNFGASTPGSERISNNNKSSSSGVGGNSNRKTNNTNRIRNYNSGGVSTRTENGRHYSGLRQNENLAIIAEEDESDNADEEEEEKATEKIVAAYSI